MKIKAFSMIAVLLCFALLCSGCADGTPTGTTSTTAGNVPEGYIASVNDVPTFSGEPYVAICGNIPSFTDDQLVTESYETYLSLDEMGRCRTVMACVGQDIMPTEERGSIGQVKPTGWHTVKYDFVDGKYLYNRCHLIGYQLTGENANERNLITGTRYLNVEGMLPFEDMIADYVKETGNHVIYRVTPIFDGYNLLARGVQMEALSVEDNGAGVCFNVYAYNSQPGVIIDYATGDSCLAGGSTTASTATTTVSGTGDYILNTKSKKFHDPSCKNAADIKVENRETSNAPRDYLISIGYESCKSCDP